MGAIKTTQNNTFFGTDPLELSIKSSKQHDNFGEWYCCVQGHLLRQNPVVKRILSFHEIAIMTFSKWPL